MYSGGIIFEIIEFTWMISKSSRNIWKMRAHKEPKTTTVVHRNKSKISINTGKIPRKHLILLLIKIRTTKRGVSIAHDESIWMGDFFHISKYCLTMKLTSELAIFAIISAIYQDDIKGSSAIFLHKDCTILMDEC